MGSAFARSLLAKCTKRAWIVVDRLLGSMELESLTEAKLHIAKLQDTVSALLARVELLEAENLSLRSSGGAESSPRLADDVAVLGPSDAAACDAPKSAVSGKRKQRKKKGGGDMSHFHRRHVALKLMYVGSRFHGFASQPGSLRTVESDLFAALEHTKLLLGDRSEVNYSRCGRTDKGVSASGQVIALKLRSNRKSTDQDETEAANSDVGIGDRVAAARASRDQEGYFAAAAEEGEIDYVGVLNRALPEDIRVLGWCPVPKLFSARFSCLHREYKYFFLDDGLDVDKMRMACRKLQGEHDFRNFCKMDAANIHNFVRQITEIDILPAGREVLPGMGMWVLKLKGNAFLWHQVRCVASVLFMVGSGKEPMSTVDDLLDVHKTPRKPQYLMASELPLQLHACGFQGLSFKCSRDAAKQLHLHLRSLLTNTLLSAELLRDVVTQLPQLPIELACHTIGGPKHIPLTLRPTEPTYEERQRKALLACPLQLSES